MPSGRDRARRLRVAIIINLLVVVVQIVAGFAARSIGLIADASHNIADVVTIGASLVAVHLAARAPTLRRSYGNHRATILAAQGNAVAMLILSSLIGFEAVRRLVHPAPVHGGVVLIIAAIATVANLGAARVVDDHTDDLNMRSAWLHLISDAAASGAVMIAGAVIWLTDANTWLDPAASLVVAAVIVWRALVLLGQTADVLLQAVPARLDSELVRADLATIAGVVDVHDLHIWALTTELEVATAHLMVRVGTDNHAVLDEAQLRLARHRIAHATVQVEPDDHVGCDTLDW